MQSFKSLKNTSLIRAAHSGKATVYVESIQDQDAFNRMFFVELRNVNFVPAGNCKQVLEQVKSLREQNASVPSFGLVDRDVLQRNHSALFLEPDDIAFQQGNPHGPYVKVLRRWEMENYLLHPGALWHLADLNSMAITADQLAEELIKRAAQMTPLMAANIALTKAGQKNLSSKLGLSVDDTKAAAMADIIEKTLQPALGAGWQAEHDACKCSIQSFDDQPTAPPSQRWWRLSRLIDGKMMFDRFLRELELSDSIYRGLLAKQTAERGLVEPELASYIREFIAARTH